MRISYLLVGLGVYPSLSDEQLELEDTPPLFTRALARGVSCDAQAPSAMKK
jgi:hypothetical protein